MFCLLNMPFKLQTFSNELLMYIYHMNHLLLVLQHIFKAKTLLWRHNEHDGISNHQRLECLHNHVFRLRSKKTSKLHVTGLCAGNSPVTGEFPAQRASNSGNVSIWWRHHDDTNYMAAGLLRNGFVKIHANKQEFSSLVTDWLVAQQVTN